MWDFLRKRPMLLSALAASVVSVVSLYSEGALFVICFMVVASIVFALCRRIKPELIFALVLLLAVGVSAMAQNAQIHRLQRCDGAVCNGTFTVVEPPQNHGSFDSAVLETVQSDMLKKGDLVTVTTEVGALQYADKIKAEVKLSSLEQNKYKKGYYSQKIYLSGYVRKGEYIGDDKILYGIKRVRTFIRDKIFINYGEEQAATMMALVTGDRSHLSDEFYGNVKGAGVSHVLVVSGMHLSVFVVLFLYICNKFFYNRYLKALTILAVTAGVMAVCGFTMSIQRAGITYVFMALGLLLDRENTPENTLGAAVVAVLIISPFAIFSVAFLLSVLSTFAILVVAIPICEFLKTKGYVKSKLLLGVISMVLVSLFALLFTSPVAIYVFGHISNVSIVANLFISSAVSAAMILCVLGFALPIVSVPLFYASNALAWYINAVINWLGAGEKATTSLPKWSAAVAAGIIIIILCVLVACKVKQDMLELKETEAKRIKERGRKAKWQRFLNRH